MNEYVTLARRAGRSLAPLDRAREAALREARNVTQLSAVLIRGLHRGPWDAATGKRLEAAAARLRRLAGRHAYLAHHGAVTSAFGEYVEANLLRAHLEHRRPPSSTSLAVPAASYLYGLGDLVGELRRVALDALLQGRVEEAQRAVGSMEKVYEALQESQAPEPLVGLRPKIDTARSLLERTRGDLVNGKRAKELERKIDDVARLLDEAETRPLKPKVKAPKADDLDLDAAWGKS